MLCILHAAPYIIKYNLKLYIWLLWLNLHYMLLPFLLFPNIQNLIHAQDLFMLNFHIPWEITLFFIKNLFISWENHLAFKISNNSIFCNNLHDSLNLNDELLFFSLDNKLHIHANLAIPIFQWLYAIFIFHFYYSFF